MSLPLTQSAQCPSSREGESRVRLFFHFSLIEQKFPGGLRQAYILACPSITLDVVFPLIFLWSFNGDLEGEELDSVMIPQTSPRSPGFLF